MRLTMTSLGAFLLLVGLTAAAGYLIRPRPPREENQKADVAHGATPCDPRYLPHP